MNFRKWSTDSIVVFGAIHQRGLGRFGLAPLLFNGPRTRTHCHVQNKTQGAKSTLSTFTLFVLAVGEWLLILPRLAPHTAGVARPLRHIARASSSPMLPNTVLTRSQLSMAGPGFKPTTLWLDIWSGFEQHFWPHKSAHLWTDPTNPLQLSVRSARTLRLSARAHTSLNSLSHPKISASH